MAALELKPIPRLSELEGGLDNEDGEGDDLNHDDGVDDPLSGF